MTGGALTVALVGCGQIADAHLGALRRLPGARVVAVCDRHLDLAEQAAARFEVPAAFDDVGRMLDEARPAVLHVTTPPSTHRAIVLRALAAGIHVYVEKPVGMDVAEVDEMLAAAVASRRLLCAGHDQLYDPAWQECRELHRRGDLGTVVHVDCVLGYDLSGPFGRVTASQRDHWVHDLPGKVFQNTITHALYKITEFVRDEQPRIFATWFRPLPGAGFPTELRAFVRGAEVTASLLSSSAIRPPQRVTRVYGTRTVIEVDLDARHVRRAWSPTLPGALVKLELPWRQRREATRALRRNIRAFLGSRLHYFTGMHALFAEFYAAIRTGGGPPIAYPEIRRVVAMTDEIVRCCRASEWPEPVTPGEPSRPGPSAREPLGRP